MNVLQLISSEGFYGAENMLLSLANAQLRAGMRTTIAVFDDPRVGPHTGIADKALDLGIETTRIACKGRERLRQPSFITAYLQQRRPRVLSIAYRSGMSGT